MNRIVIFFISLLFFSVDARPSKILVVTGGHSYDTTAFFQLFEEVRGYEIDYISQPGANQFISSDKVFEYDLLIFYDMWQPISETEEHGYLNLTQKGVPMLFLHHSLVSYQNWEEFEKLIGGRYVENSKEPEENQSTYKHDVWVNIQVVDSEHPVTRDVNDFVLFDEVYGNFRVSRKVVPLLKTNHTESSEIIAWENSFNSSKIVYLQPGHGKHTFQSPEFRKLLKNIIIYLTENAQKN